MLETEGGELGTDEGLERGGQRGHHYASGKKLKSSFQKRFLTQLFFSLSSDPKTRRGTPANEFRFQSQNLSTAYSPTSACFSWAATLAAIVAPNPLSSPFCTF